MKRLRATLPDLIECDRQADAAGAVFRRDRCGAVARAGACTDYDTLIAGRGRGTTTGRKSTRTMRWGCATRRARPVNPKGVLYSHRATVLHAMAVGGADWLGLRSRDVVMPIVPMFHACAWGIPYISPDERQRDGAAGTGLRWREPAHRLIDEEGVTVSAAVPTVWLGLVEYLKKSGLRIDGFDRLVVGGSAAPISLIRELEDVYGGERHTWLGDDRTVAGRQPGRAETR